MWACRVYGGKKGVEAETLNRLGILLLINVLYDHNMAHKTGV